MLEAFVYPVSAVMKFWHWLLADVFSAAPDTAWVASIVLLVLTVRGFLLPFNWQVFRSSRQSLMMRPEMARLEERYGGSTDPEDVAAYDKAVRELQREHGFNPLAGCIPPLVQIPFILGLYRLLIWMSVPENGRTGANIGLLTPADIESFLNASFLGIPLPAYVSMNAEQFAALGTTEPEVRSVAIPLLICAIIFTTFNTFLSQLRSRTHMDWSQSMSFGVYRFMWWMLLLVPIMLAVAGLTGLIPVALLLYWFLGNLWTLGQTAVMWWMLVRKFPLSDDHRAHILTSRTEAVNERRQGKREKREAKWSRRRRQAIALTRPSTIPQVRRDIAAEKSAEKQERKGAKAEQKQLRKEKNRVRGEIRREQMAKRREEREAKKAQGGQPEES